MPSTAEFNAFIEKLNLTHFKPWELLVAVDNRGNSMPPKKQMAQHGSNHPRTRPIDECTLRRRST